MIDGGFVSVVVGSGSRAGDRWSCLSPCLHTTLRTKDPGKKSTLSALNLPFSLSSFVLKFWEVSNLYWDFNHVSLFTTFFFVRNSQMKKVFISSIPFCTALFLNPASKVSTVTHSGHSISRQIFSIDSIMNYCNPRCHQSKLLVHQNYYTLNQICYNSWKSVHSWQA